VQKSALGMLQVHILRAKMIALRDMLPDWCMNTTPQYSSGHEVGPEGFQLYLLTDHSGSQTAMSHIYTFHAFHSFSTPAEAIDHGSPRASATNPADLQRLASKQLVAPLQCQQASVGGDRIPHAHPDHREVQQHSVVLSAQQHIGAWTKTIAAAVRLGPARTPEPRPLPAG